MCLLPALASVVLTLLLYGRGSAWLLPALVSYAVVGILVYRGNRRVALVPTTSRGSRGDGENSEKARREVTARIAVQLAERLDPRGGAKVAVRGNTVEIARSAGVPDRRIEVHVRDAADIGIAFVTRDTAGGPFEQILAGPTDQADSVATEAVEFVCDLVAERKVLAWDARPLRGGRRFLETADLTSATLRDLGWVVSWTGTRDWQA